MIRNDTDDLIEFLNSLIAIDPTAMHRLVAARVQCNAAMGDHPTVQVAAYSPAEFEVLKRRGMLEAVGYDMGAAELRLGLLGLLNGYCGTLEDGPKKGWGPITAVYDENRLVKFVRTVNE